MGSRKPAQNGGARDYSAMLSGLQTGNLHLLSDVRKLRDGEYKRLYQQTRSFIDGIERTPLTRHRSYGASVRTIRQIRECLHYSKELDGERRTHYTALLEYFLSMCSRLRVLASSTRTNIVNPLLELTVHLDQKDAAKTVKEEFNFFSRFVAEDNDFTDLHKYKTIEEFRGLDVGEVSVYGAVVNLVPVLVKSLEKISELVSKWNSVTMRLGKGIFKEGVRIGTPSGDEKSRTIGIGTTTERPWSRAGSRNGYYRPGTATAARERNMMSRDAQTQAPPPPCIKQQRSKPRPATAPLKNYRGAYSKPEMEKNMRVSFGQQVADRNQGRIPSGERRAWHPSAKMPHNLYPQLPIHLADRKSYYLK